MILPGMGEYDLAGRTQDARMTARPEPYRRRMPIPFIRAGLVSILLLGLSAAALLLAPDQDTRAKLSNVASPVIDFVASGFLFIAAKESFARSKRLGMAWSVLAFAALLYTIGDVIWAVVETGLNVAPFSSAADGFYLAYYAAFLVGVFVLVKWPASRAELVNNCLDLAVILTAAILGFWNFLIGPIIEASTGLPPLQQTILAAYPVGDVLLFGGVLLILYNKPHREGASWTAEAVEQPAIPVFLLAAGVLVLMFADCTYSYQSLLGTYASGGLLDLTWMVANLLIGMGGIAQWAGLQPGNVISEYRPGPLFQPRMQWVKTYIPYIWVVGAFILLIASMVTPLPMNFAAISLGVSTVLGLMLIRQFITLSENHRLNVRLEKQAERLGNINRDLNLEMVERVRVQETLAFDVLHDQVTGLANRRLFLDRLGQAIKRSKRHDGMSFAVLFMDLDQFKVVNDSLGHSLGDQVLVSVGKRLEETLRSGDTVARFGGDEFAILLDDLNEEETASAIAEKVREAIARPFRLKDREVRTTASIGIVTDLVKYEYPDDLLRDVDLAMYQAKALGRARCIKFKVEMRDQAFSRLSLEEELRHGLKNKEFQLFYQPITSLESDRIVALEALVRWRHPAKGLLLPAEFLEVAEESHLILPLGDWVLNEACQQMKAWQDRYPHLAEVAIHVNLSNREFAQADLPEKVFRALTASGLTGSCLRLEITERVLAENYPTATSAIAALNETGVKVEIDEFGTGYSALAYLQQFPIKAIKIDKSFIWGMRKHRKGLGLVRAIVLMARELGMETIAEGIETGEQLNELKGLLCGFGQGFLLSQPLDAASAGEELGKMESS
jgi:diguanylate cyclase (GGDEF)-like protein